MKHLLCCVTGLAMLSATAPAAEPPTPPPAPAPSVNSVRIIKADLVEPRQPYKKDQKPPDPHKKNKQLIITIARVSTSDLGELRVRWSLIGQDVGEHKTIEIGSGDISVALTNMSPVCVTSEPPVSITYTPSKFEGGKTTPASGNRLSGWSVQVYQGAALVGEKFSPSSLKSDLQKASVPKKEPLPKTTKGNK